MKEKKSFDLKIEMSTQQNALTYTTEDSHYKKGVDDWHPFFKRQPLSLLLLLLLACLLAGPGSFKLTAAVRVPVTS